jgi:hypothetical protein
MLPGLSAVVREDENGLSEFPLPGELRSVPLFIEPSGAAALTTHLSEAARPSQREFWMPDNLCKVCYCCEEGFTLVRRRHHCRLCGQVFCNQCSSYYIARSALSQVTEGRDSMAMSAENQQVRCCKNCFSQLSEQKTVIRSKRESMFEEMSPKASKIEKVSYDHHTEDVSEILNNSSAPEPDFSGARTPVASILNQLAANILFNEGVSLSDLQIQDPKIEVNNVGLIDFAISQGSKVSSLLMPLHETYSVRAKHEATLRGMYVVAEFNNVYMMHFNFIYIVERICILKQW